MQFHISALQFIDKPIHLCFWTCAFFLSKLYHRLGRSNVPWKRFSKPIPNGNDELTSCFSAPNFRPHTALLNYKQVIAIDIHISASWFEVIRSRRDYVRRWIMRTLYYVLKSINFNIFFYHRQSLKISFLLIISFLTNA